MMDRRDGGRLHHLFLSSAAGSKMPAHQNRFVGSGGIFERKPIMTKTRQAYGKTCRVLHLTRLDFVFTAENILNLRRHYVLDILAGLAEILSWIKVIRMLGKVLTDTCRESYTEVGVHIYLTNSH